MHKALTLILILATAALASVAVAGDIDPALLEVLAGTSADQPVSVIVHMVDQAPVTQISHNLSASRATRAFRHQTIINALRDAARSQDLLLTDLATDRRDGSVLGYTSYWISNMVIVYALPDEIRRIADRADVAWVEINFVPELIRPTDVHSAGDGESLDRLGITPGLEAIHAPEVWNELGVDGSGAIIGSCDTGVMGSHAALASRWRGTVAPAAECWLDVLGTGPTFPVDNYGHGTHTVGTMCGQTASDTIGVAPGAMWIAANPIDQNTGTEFDNDVIHCFQWFADPDGDPNTIDDVPDVVQNSWGVNEGFSGYNDCDSRWWAVIDNCEAAGVCVTWSAGNEGPSSGTLRSPADRAATIYNCFSVGAIDATNYSAPWPIASFSSRGPTTCPLVPPAAAIKPEVSAPGVDVYSSYNNGGYTFMSGTSMAGPHVAGVVALMRSANPNLEVDLIKQILMDTAVDEGATGEDNTFGWGVVNARLAVEAAMNGFGTLAGTITNASGGGTPLPGARVELAGTFYHYTSNAAGQYSGHAAPGMYDAVFSLDGFAPQTVPVVIGENAETTQDVSLVDIAGPSITNVSQPITAPETAGPNTITADVADFSGVANVVLNYRTGASAWMTEPMTGSGTYSADIPAQPADTQIDYYVSATDGAGLDSTSPAGAPADVYTLLITASLYSYEAEDPGDPDWQLGAAGDAATSGIWVRADPVGTEYNGVAMQPEDDHTPDPGVACFVTGNGTVGGAAGDEDVDGGCTTLISPTFDLSAYDRAFVTYWRWYGEGGLSIDDDFVVEASDDGGATWTELERVTDIQNSWQKVAVDLGTLPGFALTDQVMVRFLACDLNSGGLVEAGIDDFAIEVFNGFDPTAVGDGIPAVSPVVALDQNHPNPFNPSTTIAFSLPRETNVSLAVYTIDGRRVAQLIDGTLPAGAHSVVWNGHDAGGRQVASGAYFYRLDSGAATLVRRMVLVK